ncbi:MAG: hypothetical protein ACI91O_000015 [Candidatus Poriferisodalaceae bacterium]
MPWHPKRSSHRGQSGISRALIRERNLQVCETVGEAAMTFLEGHADGVEVSFGAASAHAELQAISGDQVSGHDPMSEFDRSSERHLKDARSDVHGIGDGGSDGQGD